MSEEQIEAAVQAADRRAAVEPTPRTVFRWAVAAGLGLLAVWLGYRVLAQLGDVVVQVLIAVFIAISLDPAVRWMVRHGIRRGHAVTVILLGFLALLALFLWVVL